MNEKKWSKNISLIIILILLIVVALGIAYALTRLTLEGKKEQIVRAGSLILNLGETGNAINITEAMPTSDSEGAISTGFEFTIENKGSLPASFYIYLDDVELESNYTRLQDENIKYEITKDGSKKGVRVLADSITEKGKEIYYGEIEVDELQNFTLRLWVRDDFVGEIGGKAYKGKLRIEASSEKYDANPQALGFAKKLISEANGLEVKSYEEGDTTKMYTFMHDETEQTEALTDYRYIGNSPNNYITFNDETWRIIGVFPVENEQGKLEQRVKIINDSSIAESAFSLTNNNWLTSGMQIFLNEGDYYNSTGNYINRGLKEESKELIAPAKWYLGTPFWNTDGDRTYTGERGRSMVYSGNSTNWIGEIGLIYPSDYLYTFALGIDDVCYSTNTNCTVDTGGNPSSSWLFKGNIFWTISVQASENYNALCVYAAGKLNYRNITSRDGNLYPVIYLKSDVETIGGDGSSTSPFLIS